MKARLFILFLLIVLILIFILQNTMPVDLSFLAWTFNISLIVLVLITLLTGIVLGMIISRMIAKSEPKDNDKFPQSEADKNGLN